MPPSAKPRPSLEVADILRGEATALLTAQQDWLSSAQRRVVTDLTACRTAALGGHVQACNRCDHREIAYNSCRNRHCPKCQGAARAQWLTEREAELLPIAYFHIVFTLPAEIAAVALQNKRLLYGMLFQAASSALSELAAKQHHLGAAQLGILAVLHTWGQNLMHHPHLHCVVSGGGLSADNRRWIASRDDYFLPVKLLSQVFRQKFCGLLASAFQRGQLAFYGKLLPLSQPEAFDEFLKQVGERKWVVYAKRPFREPACVLRYLARYTHRVAISNHRLVSYRDGKVSFRYKDYARQGAQRTMTLSATEFIRRFLLHVLPSGFMRIRHYGFLANRHRQQKLARCRHLLGDDAPSDPPSDPSLNATSSEPGTPAIEGTSKICCPVCQTGRLEIVDSFDPLPRRRSRPPSSLPIPYQDSS